MHWARVALELLSRKGRKWWKSRLHISRTAYELRLQAPNTCSIVLLISLTACKFKYTIIENFKMVTKEKHRALLR